MMWYEGCIMELKFFFLTNWCQGIVCGVPKTLVLGPKFCVIDIKKSTVTDDTNVLYSDGIFNNLTNIINHDLANLKTWVDINKLSS